VVLGAEKGRGELLQDEVCETKPISRGDPSSLPAVRRVA